MLLLTLVEKSGHHISLVNLIEYGSFLLRFENKVATAFSRAFVLLQGSISAVFFIGVVPWEGILILTYMLAF